VIVAGAGTGKTRTLVARVAHLVEQGVDPERLLLLTFSRRAGQEMIDRVGGATERRAAARIWGGTFHAIANRLLRMHGESVGLPPSFTVLDQGDARDLFGLVRAEHGATVTGRRFPRPDTIATIYSRVVNAQSPIDDTLRDHFPWCVEHADALRALFRAYTERKRAVHVLDYDDLLLFWRALIRSPEAGGRVQSRFDHVLVDEYQDTNRIQSEIVAELAAPHNGVTVVGDDAQAIYGFRAATVENLRNVTETWPDAEIVTLEQNYRSTMPILAAANALLAQSPDAVDKQLWSERHGATAPLLVACADEAAQSTWIAERVLELREQGVDLREQAILFRTAHHSDHLELELTRRDIPFVKYGGLKFLESAHVKDLLALLRLLENGHDELAWSRVLGSLDGVGPATTRRVLAELGVGTGRPGDPLARFLEDGDGAVKLPGSAEADAALLRQALDDCAAGSVEGAVQAQIERLREFCKAVFPRRYSNSAARLGDLDQLAVTAGGFTDRERFLTELVLDPPERTGDWAGPPHMDDEYLTLSTIHSAKGLEWRAVTVIHAADGNIPSDMALNEPEGLDEELRLLYVALTRAKDYLHVTWPLRFHVRRFARDDRHLYAQLSRFLEPMRSHFEEIATEAGAVGAGDSGVSRRAVVSGAKLSEEVDALLDGLLR
jgi:DNA helicase-2/ATP-dependent DNA helicase PcrA